MIGVVGWLLGASCAGGMPAGGVGGGRVAATDPRLGVMGRSRVVTGADGTVSRRLGFPGVTVRLRWRGASPVLVLTREGEHGWFEVRVDGQPPTTVVLEPGTQRISLPAGDAAKEVHTATVVRRNESWQGTVRLDGVELEAGTVLLDPPPAAARRLMAIGDSITCGAGTHHDAPGFPEGAAGNDATASFGWRLAQALEADVHLVSYGGRGLVRDWQGLTNTEIANAPVFFERAAPDDEDAPWDHAQWTPDVVLVALGTNDFNLGVPDRSEWLQAYEKFLVRLREVHPRAEILILSSPILTGEKQAVLDEWLREVVRIAQERGDRAVSYHDLAHQPGGPKDGHPTAEQHGRMVEELLPKVRAKFRTL